MDEDILKTALGQVKATVSVIQSRQKFHSSTLQEKHLYPPNANCERQRKFLSIKKKRGSSVTTMTKPYLEDIARCKNVLKNVSHNVVVFACRRTSSPLKSLNGYSAHTVDCGSTHRVLIGLQKVVSFVIFAHKVYTRIT